MQSPSQDLNEQCCVSYTIAFHVVFTAKRRALPGEDKNETWAGGFA
jgi:hypothetical protein